MSDALAYLKDFRPDPELLALADIGSDRRRLPDSWVHVLSAQGGERVRRTLDLWASFGDLLPELLEKLRERLVSVELLRYRNAYSLLYGVRGRQETLYYEARNPLALSVPRGVAPLWDQLPSSIHEFYAVHNGWFDVPSHALGPRPVEDMFVLCEEEWGILEDIEPPDVDLDRTVALFTNGMGAYVCIDLSKPRVEQNAVLWDSKKAPRTGLDFWGVVDAWSAIGLDADE